MVGAGRGRFLGCGGLGAALGLGCYVGRSTAPGLAVGFVELGVELFEGFGLVGQSGVGVDVRGDGDVGVAEEFLDGDQGDAAFDE